MAQREHPDPRGEVSGGPTLAVVRERLHAEIDTFIGAYWAVTGARGTVEISGE